MRAPATSSSSTAPRPPAPLQLCKALLYSSTRSGPPLARKVSRNLDKHYYQGPAPSA